MTSFVKQLVAQIATACSLAFSVWLCCSLHAAERPFGSALLFTFLLAGCMTGCGIFFRFQKFPALKPYRADCRMILYSGLALLIAAVCVFISFGGTRDFLSEDGRKACNALIMVLSMFPALFLIRATVVSLFARDDNKARLKTMRAVTGILWGAAILLVVCGVLFATIPAAAAV